MKTIRVLDAEANTEKYKMFAVVCRKLESYFQDKELEDNLIQEIIGYVENMSDFDINDIVINWHARYRYTTVLEYVLKTEKYELIKYFYKKYDINKNFSVEKISYDLLTAIYANLNYGSYTTDVITELIFKFETLDFLKEQNSSNQKLVILNYFKVQAENRNYLCSDSFLEQIKLSYKEALKYREAKILSELSISINQAKNDMEKIVVDLQYEASEKFKRLYYMVQDMSKELKKEIK